MVVQTETRKPIRVLLIGFRAVMQEGLCAIMAKDPGVEFAGGDITDAEQAVLEMKRLASRGSPVDVVLVPTRASALDGVQTTQLVKDNFPDAAVLVFTDQDNDSHVIDAIHAGAGGFIFMTDMSAKTLLQSIHRVTEGGTQMKTALLRNAVDALIQNGRKTLAERTAEAAHLTVREVDVLRLMGNGDSNKVIADTLGITLDTAKKHVSNVIAKLQARSRTHAAIIAAQAGIVGNTPLQAQLEPALPA